MKGNFKRTFGAIAVCLLVMVGIPLGFRLWMIYDPPTPTRPLSETFAMVRDIRRQQLLVKPLKEWSAAEAGEMPRLHRWLEAHADRVLPWEVTETAREKDTEDYVRKWTGLLDEEVGRLDAAVRGMRWRAKKLRIGGKVKGWMAKVTRRDAADPEREKAVAEAERTAERLAALWEQGTDLAAAFRGYGEDARSLAQLSAEARNWLVRSVMECP